jgi:serine/threonine-protein kinase RsbW
MFGGPHGGEASPDSPMAWQAAGSGRCDERLILAVSSWARAFPGTAQQVRAARRFAASLLDGSPFRDDSVIVISELFTNAIVHTGSGKPGGLVIVQVSRWRLGVRIAVTDQGSAQQPVIRDTAAAREPAEHGHGLYLVAQLASHLDWHDDASGRTIHAVLGVPPAAPGGYHRGALTGEPAALPQLA